MSEDKINAVQAEWVEKDMAATDFADELSDEALDREQEGGRFSLCMKMCE